MEQRTNRNTEIIQMIKSYWLREEDETFSIWKVKSNKYVYCSNVKRMSLKLNLALLAKFSSFQQV